MQTFFRALSESVLGRGFGVLSLTRVCWCSRPGGETGESKGHSGGALVPKGHGLDAGKDFPLVSCQSHSHVEKIPETNGK